MPQVNSAQQLQLLEDPHQSIEVQVLTKARGLYLHSKVLRARHPSFEQLMADPISGRCVRMAAAALVRSQRTQGG